MTVNEASIVPSGIYSPIITFFKNDEDYTLDIDTQVEHAKFLYSNGISGLVVSGSMGEASHLTKQDRHDLVAGLRRGVPDDNFKLIAGAPPMANIQEVFEESISVRDAGANFIILLVPGFFGTLVSQDGLVDYFQKAADKSVLPVIIYNYPGTSNNVTLTLDSFEKLSKHPNIVGVKLTHFNLDMYALIGKSSMGKADNFRAFTGLGQVLIPALSVGLYGTIDGLSQLFPKVMVQLLKLFQEGKLNEAAELQYLVTKADMMLAEYNIVGVKYALKELYGFGKCLTGRPPLSKGITADDYKKYEHSIETLRRIEESL